MFERKVLFYDVAYRKHQAVSITHDAVVGQTIIFCDNWNDASERLSTQHFVDFNVGMSFAEAEDILMSLPEFTEVPDEASELLEQVLDIITDEQAEQIPQVFGNWAANVLYKVGSRVKYSDILYRCIQAHTSQEGWEPPTAPSLWVRTTPEGVIPDWIQPTGAQDAYNTGDKVKHNSKTWQSTIDSNVWEPGVYGWAEVTV